VILDDGRRAIDALPERSVVLDVGGWAEPTARADWVIDLMPYESRGLYGTPVDPAEERFDATTWVQRDVCDRMPWPFEADQFDFVLCSQTLEDLRDPIWVCSEIQRVGRAGYVEVPSRLAEQSAGLEGPLPGWSHHRWICDVDDRPGITFTFKTHLVHLPQNHLPASVGGSLSAAELAQGFVWEGSFAYEERIHLDGADLDAELRATVEAARWRIPVEGARRRRWLRR
jgi:hypothetical protein